MNKQPNPADISLEKGKALIIVGPQGSGKTTLARAIAERYGSYVEAGEFRANYWKHLLEYAPKTVIFDGFDSSIGNTLEAKRLVTTDEIKVQLPYNKAALVFPAPNFIFCSGDERFLKMEAVNRRFFVVEIGQP